MDSPVSYCATHQTYPAPNEPCWQCANPFILEATRQAEESRRVESEGRLRAIEEASELRKRVKGLTQTPSPKDVAWAQQFSSALPDVWAQLLLYHAMLSLLVEQAGHPDAEIIEKAREMLDIKEIA